MTLTPGTTKRPKRYDNNTIGFNQNSGGARGAGSRASNISDKPQPSTDTRPPSTSTRPPSTSTRPPSTSTRRPSTETNPQPISEERPPEMIRGAVKDFFSRSKPTTSSSSASSQGQPYHAQPGVPLGGYHTTGAGRNTRQEGVKHHETTEYVVIDQNTGPEDNIMDLDPPNSVPGGNQTTQEGPSSSPHASRPSQTENEVQLQLMQEKVKEDKKELDELNKKLDHEKSTSAKKEREFHEKEREFQEKEREFQEKERELQKKIESITDDFHRREYERAQDLEYYKLELNKQARRYKQQIDAMNSQLKEFDGWNSALKTKNQGLEQEKASFASQIEKMSQIVSQLNSKGLPLPPDDTYFTKELASLVSDIRAWARGFNRGRPALTIEEMNAIEVNLPDEIRSYLIDSFHNLGDLLESKSVGTKLRTRCTEAILLRFLLSSYLHERYIGMDKETYATIQNIRSSLHASDQEIRYWSALTSHLYTKTNSRLDAQQDFEAGKIAEYLYSAISYFSDSPARATKSTEASLKKIVLRVAKLGMEIAQLPFCVLPGTYPPGCRLKPETMEDIDPVDQDGDVDVNDDEEERTSIVLTPTWVKVVFDEEGNAMRDKGQRILLCKALVSCMT